jgi:hypothetical protein
MFNISAEDVNVKWMSVEEMGKLLRKISAECNQMGAEAKKDGHVNVAERFAKARDSAADAAEMLLES